MQPDIAKYHCSGRSSLSNAGPFLLTHTVDQKVRNRPFSYSTKESGSSVFLYIFIREVRSDRVALQLLSLLSTFEILQIVAKCRSILILFRIAKRSILDTV